MARYYIKVPEFVRDYYPGGAPANWREAIVADATDDGKRMTVEPLPANDRGPRIAVHGDSFYYWFGRDEHRPDTMFVMRMEPGRMPRQQPVHHFGRFERWPGGNPPGADAIDGLFGILPEAEVEQEKVEQPRPRPTPLLLGKLSGLSASAIESFRPGATPSPIDVGKALEAFRWFWRRYRLSSRLNVSPRFESILQGGITPVGLEPSEWRQLSEPFGVNALNVIALDDPSASLERLQRAIGDLSDLPLDGFVRTGIWVGLLRALTTQELRRELHGAASGLVRLTDTTSEGEGGFAVEVLEAIRDVATREQDAGLQEMVSASVLSENPLLFVARWAAALEFEHPAVEPAANPTEVPPEPVNTVVHRPVAARWLLLSSFPDFDDLRKLAAEIGGAATEVQSMAAGDEPAAIRAALEALHALAARIHGDVSRLPSASAVATLARHGQNALDAADAAMGPLNTDRLLAQVNVTPEALSVIAMLVADRDDLLQAPAWLVWPDEDAPFPLENASPFDLALLLADSQRRQRWQKFLDYVRQIGEPETVKWLRPPVGGATVDDALVDWFEGTRSFLKSLDPDARAEALADPGASPAALQELERELADLAARLSTAPAEWVRAAIRERPPTSRAGFARSLAARVDDFCRTTRLKASMVTTEMLNEWSDQPAEAAPEPLLKVQHNWVGQSGARATLSLVQADPSRDLGYLQAPLVVESDEAREWNLRIRWDVKGDWRSNWPAEFPSIEPEQLSVARYQWRREGDDGPFQHTFTLRVPVRTSRDHRRRFDLSLSVEDSVTGDVLVKDQPLRWDAINYEDVPIKLNWRTAGTPDDVDEHPIGPQARASLILDRLSALSCTAVIAPRRFGKTTLVNYLVRELRARKVHAVSPIVCTEFRLGRVLDYAALWSKVSDDLYSSYDTGLPGGWSGPLPPEEAFDAVRRAAHRAGHSAIVLLFDEAQLFFPSDRGAELGSKLKARLEGAWCQPAKGMVPLLFCFVGLPPLVHRAGADLAGLLVPIEATGMTEEELRPLIATKAPTLQTTRGLRAELARTAGNLFILRVLLQRLAELVSQHRRLWASIDDLIEVSRSLAHDLRDGREESVAAYIRDVLNEADDVNEWQPVVCVPVAAAIADQRPASTSVEDLIQRATERLNEWSRASVADSKGRPVYDEQAVRGHMARLNELRVLKPPADFQSVYLEAWLSGLARRWTADETFRSALFSGAQRRIALPSGAEIVHEAGNTRILKVEDPVGALAYRVRTLEDDRDREIFQESISVFDGLQRAANRSEDGTAFIFRLEAVGLSSSDAREAVQVYRWVEGDTLASKLGALPTHLVIDIGVKLARALRLLHAQGILHRDIQPGNVVIDEGDYASEDLRPVLIDFGFARLVGREMRTRIAGEFSAPEAAADKPEWSRASDVYSLCSTLRAVLDREAVGAVDLLEVLERGLIQSPASRPTATLLGELIEELAENQKVQQQREDAWARVRARIRSGAHLPELSATVNRHRTVLEMLEANAYRTQEERHRVIADIVNQLAESKTRSGLARIGSSGSAAVQVLHALRVLHAHSEKILQDGHRAALAGYRASKPEERSGVVLDGVKAAAKHLAVPTLVPLLEPYV